MIRTQVYLSDEHRALRTAAEREGLSMTALLRKLVDQNLRGKTGKAGYPKDAIMAFVGLGASGRDDISERHDEALAEAFGGKRLR
jgi:hypothetical protein